MSWSYRFLCIFILSIGICAPPVGLSAWKNITVDADGEPGINSCIVLDSNQFPHCCYYNDQYRCLNYTYQNATGWHTETIDDQNIPGRSSSIAVDVNDHVHVSYGAGVTGELMYAFRDHLGWHTESVIDDNGSTSSICIDDHGYPHISYQGMASLKYAVKDGSGWNIETVESGGHTGLSPYMDMDSLGFPHIIYGDSTQHRIEYAYKNSTGWHIESIEITDFTSSRSSLKIDSQDKVHVTYFNVRDSVVRYGLRDQSGWHLETVTNDLASSSLALDVNDTPHIVFSSAEGVWYAYKDMLGWNYESVWESFGSNCSLALDANGFAHISYKDIINMGLKYASNDPDFLVPAIGFKGLFVLLVCLSLFLSFKRSV